MYAVTGCSIYTEDKGEVWARGLFVEVVVLLGKQREQGNIAMSFGYEMELSCSNG